MAKRTKSVKKVKKLTLDSIKCAIEEIPISPETILEEIHICKKHWKELEKHCEIKNNSDPHWGSLSGIRVIIKPYLKKVKLFYRQIREGGYV